MRLAAESALAPALEEAIATGMIEALPARRLQYRFTHELPEQDRKREAVPQGIGLRADCH